MLELGGNDPLIVLATPTSTRRPGSRSAAPSPTPASAAPPSSASSPSTEIADELAERVAAGAAALRCGDPLDEATDVGTVIDEAAAVAIAARIEDAVAAGARLLYGGQRDGALLTPGGARPRAA